METLTVAALTALHSLCHRIGLTREEQDAVTSEAPALAPAIWEQSARFLVEADAAGSSSRFDIGFSALIVRWLGFTDEAACIEHYGSSIGEALSRDCGRLAAVARAVAARTGPRTKAELELRARVSGIWSTRAGRLAYTAGDNAAIEALERSLHVSALPPDMARSVWRDFVQLCERSGRSTLAEQARRRRARIAVPDGEEEAVELRYPSVLGLLILRCITHGDLLSDERDLDPHIDRSPEEWKRVQIAVQERRVHDIPVPTEISRAWCAGDEVSERNLRECYMEDLEALPAVLRAVEILCGDSDGSEVPEAVLPALRDAFAILRVRRIQVEHTYRPPEGEQQNHFYEIHQGARRPETLQRVRLLRRLNSILERHSGLDSSVLACVQLDRAAEAESTGRHEEARAHLEEASRMLEGRDDIDQAECGQVFLAAHTWASGEADRALTMLAELSSEQAVDLRVRIEYREEERMALRRVERVHRRRSDLESWCAVSHAQMAAGHMIAGVRLSTEISQRYPEQSLAWETKAALLHGHGRHRDAVTPARTALSLGGDDPTGKTLLARILSRIGPEGRQEAVECAEDAIDGLIRRMDSSSEELSILADIVQWNGGAIEFARTADGYIWRNRADEEPPVQWLGAATARCCQDEFSADLATWVARLAEAGQHEPAELARFIVDRIDYLQYLRREAAKWVFVNGQELPEEASLYQGASEVFERRYGHSLRIEGCRVALLAARSLGVHPREAKAALSLTTADAAALKDLVRAQHEATLQFRGRMTGWWEHRSAIETAYGTELTICLRASEVAQRTFIMLPGMGDRATEAAFTVLETIEREAVCLIRWAAQPGLQAAAEDDNSGLSPGTKERLKRVLDMAALDDDGLSRRTWVTKWHRQEG